MPHQYDNIPAVLKQHPNWVAWGIRGSPPKIPYNPISLLSGKALPAKAGIKETWSSYQNAVMCVERGLSAGIGYEFSGDGIYGVDLDHVIDGGDLSLEAQDVVGTLDSYTEASPSGTGLHIIVLAPGAEITRHRRKGHFIEIYGEGRYFTVTGNIRGNGKGIEPRTEQLQEVHDRYLLRDPPQKAAPTPLPETTVGHGCFLSIGLERDRVFCALWSGERRNGNESSDDIALMNKLAYWCNADPYAAVQAFLSSPYHAQKDEAHKRKCQRSDYLYNTAKNACDTVYSTAATDYDSWQNRRRERGYTR